MLRFTDKDRDFKFEIHPNEILSSKEVYLYFCTHLIPSYLISTLLLPSGFLAVPFLLLALPYY